MSRVAATMDGLPDAESGLVAASRHCAWILGAGYCGECFHYFVPSLLMLLSPMCDYSRLHNEVLVNKIRKTRQ